MLSHTETPVIRRWLFGQYFHALNANKRSITVNLKSPQGLELVKDMIRKADVMIENFAPGAIERLGLSYDVVKALYLGGRA